MNSAAQPASVPASQASAVRASYLASPSATREILDEFDFSTKHALGQNFLINDAIIAKILRLGDVCADDVVLEVGPGIGTLSVALLPRVAELVAIEIDTLLPQVLVKTCAPWAERFHLVQKDALLVECEDFLALNVRPTKLIANLPYAVAATIVLSYFEKFPFLQSETIMVQREVAERMTARPGTKEYGAYTVKLALRAECVGSFNVSPQNFMPAPRVQSSVLRLNRAELCDEEGKPLDEEALRATAACADAAFFARRKTLQNSFRQYCASCDVACSDADIAELFARARIDACRRGETLSLAEFLRLGREWRVLRG